jgi:hypothetical protein
VLCQHRLFVKRSKCSFGVDAVAYLGHTISAAGVAMDSAKVQAIHDWPQPRSARAVRGLLGLAGYYRKFVHNYGTIAAPLTALLKEGFTWNDDAAAAFSALKGAVTSAPVLALPDFTKAIRCRVRRVDLWLRHGVGPGWPSHRVLQQAGGAVPSLTRRL